MTKKGAYVDIEELLKFANSLERLAKTLDEYFVKTDQGLRDLGLTSDDAKYHEFKEKFEDDLKSLKPLNERLMAYNKHIYGVNRLLIEEYLNTKMHK